MEKRYPRGMIFGKNGWSGIGELIELKEVGIFYYKEGEEITIFVPYDSIDRIQYEEIPKELRKDEESNSTSGSATN